MPRLTLIIISTLVVLTSLTLAAMKPIYGQSIADNVCKGVLSTETGTISAATNASSCAETGDKSLSGVARRIINIFSIVVGTVSVIMIIIGGFRYIISGGDSTGVTAAKNTILYAIVGLIIVLFSQVIVRFVISNVAPIS
jgi:hypothetical protein